MGFRYLDDCCFVLGPSARAFSLQASPCLEAARAIPLATSSDDLLRRATGGPRRPANPVQHGGGVVRQDGTEAHAPVPPASEGGADAWKKRRRQTVDVEVGSSCRG